MCPGVEFPPQHVKVRGNSKQDKKNCFDTVNLKEILKSRKWPFGI
jgi:hypothetical protein